MSLTPIHSLISYKLRRIKTFLSVFLLLFSSIMFASSVTDDDQQTINIARPAHRIISLAPNLTEILFAIGAGKNIVGVSTGNDYPEASKKIPIVATASDLNLEAILALHPDLIVAWQGGNPMNQIAELKKFGIPVYCAHFEQVADVLRTMRHLAQLTGNEKKAHAAISNIEQQFQSLNKQYEHKTKMTVFYQIWQEPLMSVNQQSIINQIITLCGGKNIFANARGIAPEISIEALLQQNPEVIITSENASDWKNFWLQWPQIAAVKRHHLFQVPADLIERPGPRLILGAKTICEQLEQVRQD